VCKAWEDSLQKAKSGTVYQSGELRSIVTRSLKGRRISRESEYSTKVDEDRRAGLTVYEAFLTQLDRKPSHKISKISKHLMSGITIIYHELRSYPMVSRKKPYDRKYNSPGFVGRDLCISPPSSSLSSDSSVVEGSKSSLDSPLTGEAKVSRCIPARDDVVLLSKIFLLLWLT
jgi:hypothetical protein